MAYIHNLSEEQMVKKVLYMNYFVLGGRAGLLLAVGGTIFMDEVTAGWREDKTSEWAVLKVNSELDLTVYNHVTIMIVKYTC